ncbi:unnamed protein product [Prorocentrum cordatum]|nr:unnamed protein product [Polarella glacialis]
MASTRQSTAAAPCASLNGAGVTNREIGAAAADAKEADETIKGCRERRAAIWTLWGPAPARIAKSSRSPSPSVLAAARSDVERRSPSSPGLREAGRDLVLYELRASPRGGAVRLSC